MINDFYFHHLYEIRIKNLNDVIIKNVKNVFERKIELNFKQPKKRVRYHI